MPGSYERINYALRPAKNIERKMLSDTFRQLTEFGPLRTYRYIGFGSTYFSDFGLIHRSLGISKMLSIEGDVSNAARFRFNRPYRCIRLRFGKSSEVLPELRWEDRVILWLDYDGKLNSDHLDDVREFAAHARSGSVIVVTASAHPDGLEDSPQVGGIVPRRRLLEKRVGEERVPPDVTDASLRGWGTAATCRQIIDNELRATITDRNGVLSPDRQFKYEQLYNFRYSDGARMVTVGGVIFETRHQAAFDRCSFHQNFPFVRSGDDAYLLEYPKLTYKELHFLNAQLPCAAGSSLRGKAIPSEDLVKYGEVYRYFPRFAETEF